MAKRSDKRPHPNIVQIIRDHYANLNETNRRIADFIIQNLEKATFSSLIEISKEIGVSDTSLIRFARELGYRGYQDLREALVDYIRKIIYPSYKPNLLEAQDPHPLIDVVMKKDIEYITKTMAGVDRAGFEALAETIIQADRVFCVGWGFSSFLAEYLTYTLQYLSYHVIPVTRGRKPMIQQLTFLEPGDLVIVFDLLPYVAEVLEAVEFVRARHPDIKLVTVTNDPLAHIVQYSDLSFFFHMSGHAFRLVSLTAPMCFLNAIMEQVVAMRPEKTTRALEALQAAVQYSPLHYAQFDPQNFQWKINREKED